MRCNMVTKKGWQCKNQATKGSQTCGNHRAIADRDEERDFYLARMTLEEQAALPMAAQMAGVDAEIATLRVLMRRAVGEGGVHPFRLALATLVRTLEKKQALEAQAPDRLQAALDRVLDELDREEELL
jgi:hypothetical protein